MAYDDIGAMSGLFAPAYIHGDPVSEGAVARWNAAHLRKPPAPDQRYVPPSALSSALPPSSPIDAQRDAIARQIVQNGAGGESGSMGGLGADAPSGGDVGAPSMGAPSIGDGAPSGSPSGSPSIGTPPGQQASAPPGVDQGPANPSGTVTSAPLGPVSNAPAPTFGPTGAPYGTVAPAPAPEQAVEAPAPVPSLEAPQMQNTPFSDAKAVPTVTVTPDVDPVFGKNVPMSIDVDKMLDTSLDQSMLGKDPATPTEAQMAAAQAALGKGLQQGLLGMVAVADPVSPIAPQMDAMNSNIAYQDANMADVADAIGAPASTDSGFGMGLGSVGAAPDGGGFSGAIGSGDFGGGIGFGGLGNGAEAGGTGAVAAGPEGGTGTATAGAPGSGFGDGTGFGDGATGVAGVAGAGDFGGGFGIGGLGEGFGGFGGFGGGVGEGEGASW